MQYLDWGFETDFQEISGRRDLGTWKAMLRFRDCGGRIFVEVLLGTLGDDQE